MKITETVVKDKISKMELFLSIFISLILFFTICKCCLAEKAPKNPETESINREITDDSYLLFETGDKEEYLQFLNELDASDTYELSFVSIEVSYYGSHPFNYSIVYKKCTGEKDPTRYEYYLFESDFYPRFLEFDFEKRKEDDFWFFLDNLSNDSEIVDISIGIYCAKNHAMFPVEPKKMYFVTYRKPV